MVDEIVVFKQNSIKINNLYVDPYGVDKAYNDAKYIFITHSHYDHYSADDLAKVMNDDTIFIMPSSMKDEYHYPNQAIFVNPDTDYDLGEVTFKTIRMYNLDKPFHPKANNWCGYLINYNGFTYYVMGDTDDIKEAEQVKCDVLFIPIGGKFTMDVNEALTSQKKINYQFVIPVHYGSIVGSVNLGEEFKNKVGDNCILKIK